MGGWDDAFAFSAPAPDSTPDFNSSVTPDPTAILSDQGATGGFAATAVSLINAFAGLNASSIAGQNNAAIAAQNARLALQQAQAGYKIAEIQTAAQVALAQKQAGQTAGTGFTSSGLVTILGIAGLVLAALQFAKH